jgi:hypothetical protein
MDERSSGRYFSMRHTKSRREWTLYWPDRNSRFDRYAPSPPTRDVTALLGEIDREPYLTSHDDSHAVRAGASTWKAPALQTTCQSASGSSCIGRVGRLQLLGGVARPKEEALAIHVRRGQNRAGHQCGRSCPPGTSRRRR